MIESTSRKLLAGGMAVCMALSLSVTPADAKIKKKDAEAVAGIIALGILGAALADGQHRRGREEYDPHPQYHPSENAVGVCVHRAKRIAKRQGAYRLQVNRIDRVRERDDGSMRVVFHATGYYSTGAKTSKVRCTVWDDEIVDFNWS